MKPRLWIADNGLIGAGGHPVNNALGLAVAAQARGIDARFLVHRQAFADVLACLGARPAFRHTPYQQIVDDPLAGPLESMLAQGAAFADDLAAALDAEVSADDVLLLPTTTQHELYGVGLWLRGLPRARQPRVALNFMLENFLRPGAREHGLVAEHYRHAMRILCAAAATPPVLSAGGEGLAQALADVLGQAVQVFPLPKHYPAAWAAALPPLPVPPTIAVLGDARPEKGGALVSALVPAHADWRWLIQGHAAAWRNLPASPNVERVEAELSPDGYHALFARAGVVLLAYDPARLALRTSGVAAEAIAAGRPLVATHHTWAAEQILAGRAAGVVFPLHTVASCAEGLTVALERFDALAESAARLAPAWRATQCAAAFLDRVWAGATAPIAVPPPL